MLLHLGQNVITFRTLLHLGSFIKFNKRKMMFIEWLSYAKRNLHLDVSTDQLWKKGLKPAMAECAHHEHDKMK